jgi:hypothetical protein
MHVADEEKLNAGQDWRPTKEELSGKQAVLKERKCPRCGSHETRRSQMRGLWERGVLKTIGVRAYRCETCDHRFYGWPPTGQFCV